MCCSDYAECVVASFENQIQKEFYGGNRSVSIETTALELYKPVQNTQIRRESVKPTMNDVFPSLFLR